MWSGEEEIIWNLSKEGGGFSFPPFPNLMLVLHILLRLHRERGDQMPRTEARSKKWGVGEKMKIVFEQFSSSFSSPYFREVKHWFDERWKLLSLIAFPKMYIREEVYSLSFHVGLTKTIFGIQVLDPISSWFGCHFAGLFFPIKMSFLFGNYISNCLKFQVSFFVRKEGLRWKTFDEWLERERWHRKKLSFGISDHVSRQWKKRRKRRGRRLLLETFQLLALPFGWLYDPFHRESDRDGCKILSKSCKNEASKFALICGDALWVTSCNMSELQRKIWSCRWSLHPPSVFFPSPWKGYDFSIWCDVNPRFD